jgi:hypothetical protein
MWSFHACRALASLIALKYLSIHGASPRYGYTSASEAGVSTRRRAGRRFGPMVSAMAGQSSLAEPERRLRGVHLNYPGGQVEYDVVTEEDHAF